MPATRTRVISVLVVDDHRTFADALGIALGLERDLAVTTASDGRAATLLAETDPFDVALVDVVMPGLDGVDVMRRLRDGGRTRVIAVSAHDDDLTMARALDAGAIGFCSKLVPIADLATMIRSAAEGGDLIDPEERARLARLLRHRRQQQATERQRANRLTPRQVEILQLMADGVGPKEIARRLGVSPLTLRTHVQNILTRLGVHSKVEAIAVAMRQGRVKPVRIA
jgi:DNA-binding NarL/FixJ family response regulator